MQRLTLGERLDRAWQAWNDALEGLEDADFERSVYPHWNLRDIVGHVYSYMDLDVRHLESYKRRRRLASPRAPSYSYFNRREAARLRNVPIEQLRGNLEFRHRRLMELLPTFSAEDLRKLFPAQWSNSKYHTSLRALLREEAEHLAIHALDIEKWRKRQHVGK